MSTMKTPATVADPFAQAQAVLAGGVSASMRINPYLGRPLYTQRGSGAYLFDLDGLHACQGLTGLPEAGTAVHVPADDRMPLAVGTCLLR